MEMRRGWLSIVLAGALIAFGLGVPSASGSNLSNGSCVLNLTFDFDSPVTLLPSSPTYSVDGKGFCATPLNSNLMPTTTVEGLGSSILWTCGATQAGGSWSQFWDPAPPSVDGQHLISGTWGAWKIVVLGSGFVGSGEFTTRADQPSEALKATECATSGISKIKMTGVLTFQDP